VQELGPHSARPETAVSWLVTASQRRRRRLCHPRGAYELHLQAVRRERVTLGIVDRALRSRRLQPRPPLKLESAKKYALSNVVGRQRSDAEVYNTAARVALTDAPCWLVGESGTGKERARAIPASSARAAGPFISVECGRICRGLFGSELFGDNARVQLHRSHRNPPAASSDEVSRWDLFLDSEIGDIGPRSRGLLRVPA